MTLSDIYIGDMYYKTCNTSIMKEAGSSSALHPRLPFFFLKNHHKKRMSIAFLNVNVEPLPWRISDRNPGSRLPIRKPGNGEWKIPKYGNDDIIHSLGCFRNYQFRRMLYSSSIMPSRGPEKKGRSSYRTVVHASSLKEDMYGVDELEAGHRNPELSGNYRPVTKFKLNPTVLEAEARTCTRPTQARPLNEQQAFKVLGTILQSAKGELRNEEAVSATQLGAFFVGMTIRANAFPGATQWSEGAMGL